MKKIVGISFLLLIAIVSYYNINIILANNENIETSLRRMSLIQIANAETPTSGKKCYDSYKKGDETVITRCIYGFTECLVITAHHGYDENICP